MDEKALQRAYDIIKGRANWWENQADKTTSQAECAYAVAYKSAQCILRAALDGNWEVLNQYDDYKKE